MQTELINLPCGTVQIRVSADGITANGWVSSHHLVPPKEAQLKESIRRVAYNAFIADKAAI